MSVNAMSGALGKNEFLQLFVTQMRNQNPLEPLNNNEFIAQLAQFSTLEQITNMASGFESMLKLAEFNQAGNLLGLEVQYSDPRTGDLATGEVTAVEMQQQEVQIVVNGDSVPLRLVQGVRALE